MAYSDFLLSLQKQIACLVNRTDPDGTALPDLPITLDSEKLTVTDLEKIAGVAPQMDDTDKLAVSLYGKATAAGDVPLLTHASFGLRVASHTATWTVVDGNANNPEIPYSADGSRILQPTYAMVSNGTTWDRVRNNEEITVLASAARTAQTDSADQVNYNGVGLVLFVNVTVDAAAGAITPTIQAKDSVSSAYHTIWTAAAAIAATGTFVYLFQPGGAAGSYTEAVNLRIPRTWRLRVTVADTDSLTYSVGAVLLV